MTEYANIYEHYNFYNLKEPEEIIPCHYHRKILTAIENGKRVLCSNCHSPLIPNRSNRFHCVCHDCPKVHMRFLRKIDRSGELVAWKQDLKIDQHFLADNPGAKALHITRRYGTYILLPGSDESIRVFDSIAPRAVLLHWFDGQRWKKVKESQARELLKGGE